MNIKKFLIGSATGALMLGAVAVSVFAVVNAVTPSTNDINRTNGWAHVDQISQGVGTTDLQFISTRAFLSCFEYRTDGDTSQALLTANPNPAVSDRYPHHCQNNNSNIYTFNANGYVEVRMVFGAESDERFDWTRFDVLPPTDVCSNLVGNQSETPANMVSVDGQCSCQEGFHKVNNEDNRDSKDDIVQEDFTCQPDLTPTPTNAPSNPGGPGDGLSDGKSSCPECTQAPKSGQVLGASTTKAVLGLSTTSGEGNIYFGLVQLMSALALTATGFKFFKKNA